MNENDPRDKNYLCPCGGNIIAVGKTDDGRNIYDCKSCGQNKLVECTICHKPRHIWADDGKICWICGATWLEGKLELTPEQEKAMDKWTIPLRIVKGTKKINLVEPLKIHRV